MGSPEIDEHMLRLRKMVEEHIKNGFTGAYTVNCLRGLPNSLDIRHSVAYIGTEHKKADAEHAR